MHSLLTAGKRLRIGIDAHALGSNLGGNETYIRCLLLGLRECKTHDYVLYVNRPEALTLAKELLPLADVRRISTNPLRRLGWDLPLASFRDRLDILHLQYVAPLISGCPVSLIIHDLSYEHHPAWFTYSESLRFRWTIPRSARNSGVIMTVSEFCRQDIIQRLRLSPEKVIVTPNALAPIFRPAHSKNIHELRHRLDLPDRYILALGNLQPRKNITLLIKAWRRIRNHPEMRDTHLVIAGKKAWLYDEIVDAIDKNSGSRMHFTGYLAEKDLPSLYSGALLLVYPSLFEGFGLPPLEAMACGTPVIVGKHSALPEVCGDAAAYVDVTSDLQLGERILEIVGNPEARNSLASAGITRAQSFPLSRLAESTLLGWKNLATSQSGNTPE